MQALINLSLLEGGEVLQRLSYILNETKPDLPGSLSGDLIRSAGELERLFNKTLELAIEVQLAEILDETVTCRLVVGFDELLLELDAGTEEVRVLTERVSQLPLGGTTTTTIGEEVETATISSEEITFIIIRVYEICESVQEQFVEIFEEVSQILNVTTQSTISGEQKSLSTRFLNIINLLGQITIL